MNQNKKQTGSDLNKKSDGLSKKERRAQRVAHKIGNENINQLPKDGLKPPTVDSQHKIKSRCIQETEINVDEKNPKTKTFPLDIQQQALNSKATEKISKLETDGSIKLKDHKLKQCNSVVNTKEDVNKSAAESKTKSQLKAERRALQEKQRLAKTDRENDNKEKKTEKLVIIPKKIKLEPTSESQVYLFNHLYFQNLSANGSNGIINGVHSSFIRLGVQYSSKTILGSNARCLALLSTLRELISCFVTPPKQEFCRSLESALHKCTTHLQKCRPFAVSMTNALKYFNLILTQIDTNISDSDKKEELLHLIDVYRKEQIAKAGEAISIKVNEKITNDDIILTYGCSSLIRRLLLDAHILGKKFKVIIIDSRPLLEGREMLRVLTSHDIDCTYVLINSVSFIMNKATKVLLGAHALLANGYVMSRTGTAQVALIAQAHNKPVLVCCETYKFCERVQTDCFVYNEIGDPDKLTVVDTLDEESPLIKWRNCKSLTPLNLLYDVTPPDFVTAVVTELGFLPCTSVPVVLRIKPTE